MKARRLRITRTTPVARVKRTTLSEVEVDVGADESWITSFVTRPPAAVVLAVDYDKGRVGLAYQGRIGSGGEIVLEAAAGLIDEGETPEEAALRELKEELGLVAASLKRVSRPAWASPGWCNEVLHLFIAWDLTETEPIKVDNDVELRWVSFAELDGVIDNAEDVKTIAVTSRFLTYLLRGVR
jgi:8-oxo-dGTP pyrophosphatase MutT (NUDIX family)